MTNPLWTSQELAQATSGQAKSDFGVSNVVIDSRAVKPGDLFVAIRGENNDGHSYIPQVVAAGASGIITEEIRSETEHQIQVANSFEALWDIAQAARNRSKARFIGITGSVGKTSTKELLLAAFSALGITDGTAGNLNNHFGLPLTLSRLSPSSDYAVLEMGMSAPEEIRPLSKLSRPHVAIITAIAPAHSEFFSSTKEIANAKSEIFDGIEPYGTAILNGDDYYYDHLKSILAEARPDCQLLTFGSNESFDAYLNAVTYDPMSGKSRIAAQISGKEIEYELSLNGRHQAINSLAVLLAIKAVDGDLTSSAKTLKNASPLKGRGRITQIAANGGQAILIDESYNASPEAVKAAIKSLAQIAPPTARKILVLGDMLELGAESEAMHASLLSSIKEANLDTVFTSGTKSKALHHALPAAKRGTHWASAIDLAEDITSILRQGDHILIKGSLGSKMGPLVEAISEREHKKNNAL
jgi:UDP-N-acetylmuramoyl-tripeptide--D-alanyl-D-alanine ligase